MQRGPSFKEDSETSVEASTGQITVRYKDKDGKEKVLKEQHELPPDVANGLLFTLVKHIQPKNYGLSLASDTEGYSGHLHNAQQLATQSLGSAVRADSKEVVAL